MPPTRAGESEAVGPAFGLSKQGGKTSKEMIALSKASRTGNISEVKKHLAAGADVNEKAMNWNGYTPLHLAASMKGNKEIVELLIAKGADVNANSESGSTPLHGAYNGEIVELLITKGSNVNVRNGVGQTPLLLAVIFGQKEIVKILVAKGADVHARDDAGVTPLDMSRNKPEIADLLRKHGARTGEELKAAGN